METRKKVIRVREIVEKLDGRLPYKRLEKWIAVFEERQWHLELSDQRFVKEYGGPGRFSLDTYNRYKRMFREAGIGIDVGEIEENPLEILETMKDIIPIKTKIRKLTEEERVRFFQAVFKKEKEPEERRRLIKLWHLGKIKVWKSGGRIHLEIPPKRVLLPEFGGKLRTASWEEWERGEV